MVARPRAAGRVRKVAVGVRAAVVEALETCRSRLDLNIAVVGLVDEVNTGVEIDEPELLKWMMGKEMQDAIGCREVKR